MKNEFPGTDEEKLALYRAVNRNCGCEKDSRGARTTQVGCHELLVPDQDSQTKWKRLIFMRRNAGKLLIQELSPQSKVIPAPHYTPHYFVTIARMAK